MTIKAFVMILTVCLFTALLQSWMISLNFLTWEIWYLKSLTTISLVSTDVLDCDSSTGMIAGGCPGVAIVCSVVVIVCSLVTGWGCWGVTNVCSVVTGSHCWGVSVCWSCSWLKLILIFSDYCSLVVVVVPPSEIWIGEANCIPSCPGIDCKAMLNFAVSTAFLLEGLATFATFFLLTLFLDLTTLK